MIFLIFHNIFPIFQKCIPIFQNCYPIFKKNQFQGPFSKCQGPVTCPSDVLARPLYHPFCHDRTGRGSSRIDGLYHLLLQASQNLTPQLVEAQPGVSYHETLNVLILVDSQPLRSTKLGQEKGVLGQEG